MYVIGERINGMFQDVKQALQNKLRIFKLNKDQEFQEIKCQFKEYS